MTRLIGILYLLLQGCAVEGQTPQNSTRIDQLPVLASTPGSSTVGRDDHLKSTTRENRIDIVEFIMAYASQESIDIVVDPRVKGWVQLFSKSTPDVITKDEFHLVLNTHGYASYREGDLTVVVQQVLAKQRKLPQYDGGSRKKLSAHQVVTAVIKVKHRSADTLASLFRPLVEQWGYIKADESTNSLLVVTTLGNAERLHGLVKNMDQKPGND